MKKNYIIKYLLFFILCIIVIPFLIVCFYGLPSKDDFAVSLGWMNYDGNHFIYMIINSYTSFMKWQGTFFGCFLASIPVFYLFGIEGVKLVYFLSTSLFFISFILFVFSVSICAQKNFSCVQKRFFLIFSSVCLYYLLSSCSVEEVFYWWTGISVYTIPCSCLFLCLSFFIFSEIKQSLFLLIISALFAFAAVGGALNVSSLLCSILLFIIIFNRFFYCILSNKNVYLIFGIALIFSFINSIAPGNFVRHSVIDTETNFVLSFFLSFKRVLGVLFTELQLSKSILFILFFVCFVLGFFFFVTKSKITLKKIIFASLYGILSIVMVDYPVILGYSSADNLPSRCLFIEHLAITLYVSFISIYLGAFVYQKKIFSLKKSTVIVISLFLCSQMPDFGFRNFVSLKIVKHLYSHDYMNYYKHEMSIIDQIQSSVNDDVIVTVEPVDSNLWTNLKSVGLSTDKSYWVNESIAKFFNKKSVVLKYINKNM